MRASFDPAVDSAIEWMVLLRSGEASSADIERHRRWCDADERHAQAWARVTAAVGMSVAPLRDTQGGRLDAAAKSALLRPARRRAVRRALLWGGLAAGTGWLVQRQWPPGVVFADLRTGTGERRTLTLADGSHLIMNARSAVDIRFAASERRLQLRAGEIIVQATPDAARPFIVETAQGTVTALGTRFLVRQEEDRTLAAVMEHRVEVRIAPDESRVLNEGESAYFRSSGIEPSTPEAAAYVSWERGLLTANDWSLAQVINALRSYRSGYIRVSPEVADMRVLGAFSLDDTDHALESLAQTLPLRVSRYGSWLVVIEAQH